VRREEEKREKRRETGETKGRKEKSEGESNERGINNQFDDLPSAIKKTPKIDGFGCWF
jgi:hypothetical protein